MYTLGEAARTTGRAKSTILRDIRRGKLSAAREADGVYRIDPAELHRVYSSNGSTHRLSTVLSNDPQPVSATAATGFERREIDLLRDQVADLRETIRDLRERLDLEAAERRQLSERLHGLLTRVASTPASSDAHSPTTTAEPTERLGTSPAPERRSSVPLVPAIPPQPWWRRWFR